MKLYPVVLFSAMLGMGLQVCAQGVAPGYGTPAGMPGSPLAGNSNWTEIPPRGGPSYSTSTYSSSSAGYPASNYPPTTAPPVPTPPGGTNFDTAGPAAPAGNSNAARGLEPTLDNARQTYPAPQTLLTTKSSEPPPDPIFAKPTESTWYARVEYAHWNERSNGADFVNEYGFLYTVGYQHQFGPERVRLEMFGGSLNYNSDPWDSTGTVDLGQDNSVTNYIGLRGEYDLRFGPDFWPDIKFLIGVGSRFWIRDLPNSTTSLGNLMTGYQETWWTLYPFLGFEWNGAITDDMHFFLSLKGGVTAATYHQETANDSVCYPQTGGFGNLELGVRGHHFTLATYFEAWSWGQSNVVTTPYDPSIQAWQPASSLVTVGGRVGFSF